MGGELQTEARAQKPEGEHPALGGRWLQQTQARAEGSEGRGGQGTVIGGVCAPWQGLRVSPRVKWGHIRGSNLLRSTPLSYSAVPPPPLCPGPPSVAVVSPGLAVGFTSPFPGFCIWGHLFRFYCFWLGLWYSFTDQITASPRPPCKQLATIPQPPAPIAKGRIRNQCVQANRCCHLKNRSIQQKCPLRTEVASRRACVLVTFSMEAETQRWRH